MNMNMGMNNMNMMNMNQGMSNMNQIYMQISQLMAQAMININQIMTNMNQLMTNMNQMNQLINNVNNVQPNNELNNINFMMNNTINMHDFYYFRNITFESYGEPYTIQCNIKEKLKDVIQKYKIKSGDTNSNKFIYNNHSLNLELTIEESGIRNDATIICIETGRIQGGNLIQ